MAVTINDKERVYGLAVKQGNAFEIHQRAEAEEYISQMLFFVAESFREVEQMMILSIYEKAKW